MLLSEVDPSIPHSSWRIVDGSQITYRLKVNFHCSRDSLGSRKNIVIYDCNEITVSIKRLML
ncbi:hypothetical protein RchiOBHm_Chr3g0455251 [Rosa chinensis]|uniref:Uncharacterized protein n=1 Tax=Rosa chinensis TaxID=74649 RepID=A0A2P6R725_ROSCH|nr:hypothetical protein RchiOBHm_Chr3g0455251 [Rosa chinensis]